MSEQMEGWGPKKVLSDIYRAFQVNGWEFIEIWGKKSWGKTTIAMLFLGEFFGWDWNEVFDYHLVFTLEQFASLMGRARDLGQRNPLILWDDAAVYMGKYKWTDEATQEFTEFFTAIRTYVNCLIVTSPKPNLLVKGLREDFTKKIEITRPIWSGRGMFYYQNLIWYDDYYGSGVKERKHLKEFGSFFPLPDEVYVRYDDLRQKYLGEVKLDKLFSALAKRAKPDLTPGDLVLLRHLAQKGIMSLRSFQGDQKWVPYRKTLNKFRALSLVELRDDKVTLTEFGERAWEETQKDDAKKAIEAMMDEIE